MSHAWLWGGKPLAQLSDRRLECVLDYMLHREKFGWQEIDVILDEIEARSQGRSADRTEKAGSGQDDNLSEPNII